VENAVKAGAQMARVRGIDAAAALRLMSERPGTSQRHAAVQLVMRSPHLMDRITKNLVAQNVASLARTSRAQRDVMRSVHGLYGNVLWASRSPKYEVVGPKGQLGLVRVPHQVREPNIRDLRVDRSPLPEYMRHMSAPVLSAASDRGFLVGALGTAVEHFHTQTTEVIAEMQVLYRGLRASKDLAAHDVHAFIKYVQTRPSLARIKASLDEDVVDRLSTRGLYLIYYVYTLLWDKEVRQYRATLPLP
jgi:hypothetical protein